MSENGSGDVVIHAPAASLAAAAPVPGGDAGFSPGEITPELAAQILGVRVRELEDQLRQFEAACKTISNVAITAIKLLAESQGEHGHEYVLPRELSDHMIGAQITVAETGDGDVLVRIRDRGPDRPLGVEDA